jgi:glutathione S-transferase
MRLPLTHPTSENLSYPYNMITVHHLNNSRSQRILWLLEELGLDYEIEYYQRDPETMLAPASLRRVHPLGKSPVITDDTLTLAESGAIIEYLVERYGEGRLAPPLDVPERLRYRYWLHYAEGSLMPPLLIKLIFDKMEEQSPFLLRPIVGAVSQPVRSSFINPQIALHLGYLESELAHSPWFVDNDFTAADIQMSFPLENAMEQVGLDASHPKLMEWLDRIHARPAYQHAVKRSVEFESKQ